MALKLGRRQSLKTGPWLGVLATTDPFDDDPRYLVDATNGYIPDPQTPSGFYGRPGFTLLNPDAAIYPHPTSGAYAHTDLSGVTYNVAVLGGKLYRIDDTFTTYTDVTPGAVTISSAETTRIRFVSLDGDLIVSDGVNRPWIASDLDATPITGTNIDFDGAGVLWSAQDITAYSGALVVLLDHIDGDFAQTDIAWSAPGDPSIGYQQATYDYRWTLEQTGSKPIRAIRGTNVGLYYFRELSIGLATGALGPNFQTTHTDDAVSENVGSLTPSTIVGFTDRLFFTDAVGRPWMLPLGGSPVAIWKQMRSVIEASSIAYPTITAVTSTASFDPTLNLYCVGIWSPTSGVQTPATEWYVFDAGSGTYLGRWSIASGTGAAINVECLASFMDYNGRSVLMAFGSKEAGTGAESGYAWSFNALLGVPPILSTEGGVFLTTEDGDFLTEEGQEDIWTDHGEVPNISITTARLGYSDDVVWNVDQATVIALSNASVSVTMVTPTTSGTVEGTPTAIPSADGTYRFVVGADVQGRGTQVVVRPTSADMQWSAQRVSIVAVPSLAGPEDA